ncbi:HelD family protein [Pseudonocardia abyssalis]|uniref:AAA family ATPase n=1 Tax=Pseudonocardia abyssalis TaxID=2792008 RepID=A0ABS6US18_9PSEU|nr:UvrD-helicase domain-containing protein [Pseudonocardia abyssalis]MBW0114550.1 AAA family ATPase [Pseudonocardia abyssalis]MBW0135051.1 AAA family ATPase [Pseudonocardia abyssalis]
MTDTQRRDEEQERRYLIETLALLATERERTSDSIDASVRTIDEQKGQMWENRRDMDFAEKASLRTSIDLSVKSAEHAVMRRKRIERLLDSPYFGRVDFREDGTADSAPLYIGMHNFTDPDTNEIVVHEWRAPVSSLFYDFESGPAHFRSPGGTTHGEITGKRQYKIRGGCLEYMLESSLNINDDVLQRELSQTADDRMKNIVATIQREQNAVIRNETAQVLILQGVAGSGKTSIALHRVAFLLYRFRDSLSSDNLMILSPNRVFGDYIADVLPELGEERIAEIGFDRIAAELLGSVIDHQTFSEQVVSLLDGSSDDRAAERMRYKATSEFVAELGAWIDSAVREEFTPAEIAQKHRRLSAEWVQGMFDESRSFPIFTRIDHVANCAVDLLKNQVRDRGGTWAAADTNGVRRQVRAMFPYKDPLSLYRAFFRSPDRRRLFMPLGRRKLEYADVFPLVYTMIRTTRQRSYGHIRHLVVDEMQDYTPIQYSVLRELFSCTMTILGDSNQSVNPFSSSSLQTIHSIFPEADCLELNKSYRSTSEITEFAQRISRNDKLVPVSRHGAPPQVVACTDRRDEERRVLALVERHRKGEYRSLGVICKTVAHARDVHRALDEAGVAATLLDYDSTAFAAGVVVTSAHISKGLEFDSVIVTHVDEITYVTDMDRCMLYIACTRAMHELHLTHHGPLTPFLGRAHATVDEPVARLTG